LFQQLTGSPALVLLARRAWIAMITVFVTTGVVYALSYFRTLRKIVEEPDLVPAGRKIFRLPRFGNPVQTAIIQFSIRTFLRSRQHRVMFAFYAAMGVAVTILFVRTGFVTHIAGISETDPWHQASVSLLAASVLMIGVCLLGVRAVVAVPVDIPANWIFRSMPSQPGRTYLKARRRALLLAMAVVWAGWAVLFLWNWPWRQAVGHLAILWLIGASLVEVCLSGSQKLPFTCSYQPGKSRFHMAWFYALMMLIAVGKAAGFERQALRSLPALGAILFGLCLVATLLRLRTNMLVAGQEPQFDDPPPPAVFTLDLHQDGVPIPAGRLYRGTT